MATLLNKLSKQVLQLLPHHTFGRREDRVDTHLDAPQISKIHASIEWDGSNWSIKDLSRNGIWLDKEKLIYGEKHPLMVGQVIKFVSKDQRFEINDLAPPTNFLVPNSSSQGILALDQIQLLPNEQEPKVAVHLCPDTHDWLLEEFNEQHEAPQRSLSHGDIIEIDDTKWTLLLAEKSNSTTLIIDNDDSIENFDFHFHTSQDEENTSLVLDNGNVKADLGERNHHYVLLHLARQRATDCSNGFNNFDQGWVDNELLSRELGLELAHINIQLYRIRKQLTEVMPELNGVNKLVERKRGKVRFGSSAFKIYKSGQLEVASEKLQA